MEHFARPGVRIATLVGAVALVMGMVGVSIAHREPSSDASGGKWTMRSDAAAAFTVAPLTEQEQRFLDGHEGGKLPPELATCLPSVPPGDALEGDDIDVTACDLPMNEKPNSIGTAPPPADLVRRCRADLDAESDCGVVLAVVDGALAPGQYSNEELRAAVAAAGYRWTPDR
ncbi:hypothetical protein [Nocardioides nitrophenolicus]|uniref:hypothetical protein n=1 Tax=Nocardioides nitrophenolicus TaxID=60489 RepID=UPI001957A1BC|nr:hypothetical protein [Nocardioides nitrophenolicus]MBM7516739.1 hypothetical protein [Nocardioides nitrophenolicus]